MTEQNLSAIAQSIVDQAIFPSLFCFYGDLGAGKTTLCRLIIQTFMNDPTYSVPSPTFTLIQEYDCRQGKIAHFDFYRIQDATDLMELNFDDYVNNYLCLMEWPENVHDYLPLQKIDVVIKKVTDTSRDIFITYPIYV